MKDTIKVFIASSIVEFADVRDDIENFLWRLRAERGLDVAPVRCETADPSMSVTRKEDDYCGLIRDSDICLFLFDKKLGAYSLEEYEFARRLNGEGAGPEVMLFFRGNALSGFRSRAEEEGCAVYGFGDARDVCALLGEKLKKEAGSCPQSAVRAPVNIFLASSIKDDERRRIKIENFIWKMNFEFVSAYGLSVRPLVPGADGGLGEIIGSSRMCFFIVFTRVGDEARRELEFAKKYFDRTGYPKIYVYFNAVPDGRSEERSVAEFKDYLDRELKHFYGTFDGIDTIKLRILLNLAIQETGSKAVSFKDGKCFFGGDALFSVDNVSEFANNKKLAELKAQFPAVSEEYHVCRREYERDRADSALCERFYEAGTRYNSLKKQIEDLEDKIFGVALSMSRDEVGGHITERQKRAYRYFEAGDVENAVAILDVDEALEEYRRAEKYAAAKAAEVIAEGRLKIGFLRTMFRYRERFGIMEQTYEKLLPVAAAQQICLDIYNDYALFLAERDRHREALEKALMLKTLYTVFPAAGDAAGRADNLTVLAAVSAKMSDMQRQTEEYSLQSLALREEIYSKDPSDEANNAGMASSCMILGEICRKAQRTAEAAEYLERADGIFAGLEASSDRYITEHARALIFMGQISYDRYMAGEALACYRRAEELLRRLPLNDPAEKYLLSSCWQNGASICKKIGRRDEALRLFARSRDVREELADEDPAGYMPALAYACQGMGNLLRAMGKYGEALDNFIRAYSMRKTMCARNNGAHEVELSDSCVKLAGTYLDEGRADEAFRYISEAEAIRGRLNGVSPQTYRKGYAQVLFEYGRYYEAAGDAAAAERYYERALELRTQGDVDVAVNAEALHDSFTKMKQLCGENYAEKLDPAARRVHDALYGYNRSRPEGGRIVLETSYRV